MQYENKQILHKKEAFANIAEYKISIYSWLKFYSTPEKMTIEYAYGMMGDEYLSICYSGINGAISNNTPDIIKNILKETFINEIETYLQIHKFLPLPREMPNFLFDILITLDDKFGEWLIKNQIMEF